MEKLKENIKKTNLTIGKTLKKLDRELISLEREFNWLMRQHYHEFNVCQEYQECSVDSDAGKYNVNSVKVVVDKKNTCEKITKKLDRIVIDKKDEHKISKRTKKKKRVIVWNAWVIDTSSESESDMDDRSVNDRFICSSSSDSDSD